MNLPSLEAGTHVLPACEFGEISDLLADVGRGHDPVAVMLTCWELGGAPDEMSRANPGEIMVVQNPGGLIPAPHVKNKGMSFDTILYALNCSTVRHLIVCGHTECNTVRALLADSRDQQGNLFSMLMRDVGDRFHAAYRDRPMREWSGLIVQETVLEQLARLRACPPVAARLRQGRLHLHGWIRNDRTFVITAYDPVSCQFRNGRAAQQRNAVGPRPMDDLR